MEINVYPHEDSSGNWVVEVIDPAEGEISTAIFTGPDAERRAAEYAVYLQETATCCVLDVHINGPKN